MCCSSFLCCGAHCARTVYHSLPPSGVGIKPGLTINASKTTFITFLSEAENTLLVKNGSVNSCRSFKYLGVNIDYDMSWQTHVSLLIQRVQKSLYVLHRCKGASNMLRRQQLFRAYIYILIFFTAFSVTCFVPCLFARNWNRCSDVAVV
jgi:hypothetical protein